MEEWAAVGRHVKAVEEWAAVGRHVKAVEEWAAVGRHVKAVEDEYMSRARDGQRHEKNHNRR